MSTPNSELLATASFNPTKRQLCTQFPKWFISIQALLSTPTTYGHCWLLPGGNSLMCWARGYLMIAHECVELSSEVVSYKGLRFLRASESLPYCFKLQPLLQKAIISSGRDCGSMKWPRKAP